MKATRLIVAILLVVGGLNWGLIGVADFNLVTAIFGGVPVIEKIIYILVGISAILAIIAAFRRNNNSQPTVA